MKKLLFLLGSFTLFLMAPAPALAWCSYSYCDNGRVCYFPFGFCDSPCSGGEVCNDNTVCVCESGTCQGTDPVSCSACGGQWLRDEASCGPPGGGCFIAATQIATPGGEKSIQDIKEGDTVVGLDTQTGEKVETQVQSTYELESGGYYEVTVEKPDGTEEVLKVTGEHPLFVKKQSAIASFFSTLLDKISGLIGI